MSWRQYLSILVLNQTLLILWLIGFVTYPVSGHHSWAWDHVGRYLIWAIVGISFIFLITDGYLSYGRKR